jgi:hypothetical protein
MTKSLPLRLKSLFFPTISVKAVPPIDDKPIADSYEVEDIVVAFTFEVLEDGKEAQAALKLETKKLPPESDRAALPYSVLVEVVAGFDVILPEHTDARALWMRKVAAATALIGAAREQVAMTTSRGPWGSALMPIIGLQSLVGPAPEVAKPSPKKRIAKPAPKQIAE